MEVLDTRCLGLPARVKDFRLVWIPPIRWSLRKLLQLNMDIFTEEKGEGGGVIGCLWAAGLYPSRNYFGFFKPSRIGGL